ncbi:MAG TPA: ABC transporter permease [Gammaproteobacteria bacterium]|nr:ABC transporter permease [Gammaproteobacteria bacterium]
MSVIFTVCRKEIIETLRERRTLMGLLLGPLFGPVIFAMLINVMVSRNLTSIEETLSVPMLGAERAPNLVAFLKARGIEEPEGHGVATVEQATGLVGTGEHDVVLAIDEAFDTDFGTERAARVTLIFDRSKSRAGSRIARVRGAIEAYGAQIGALRLVASGANPNLTRPLIVDELDVSTPASRAALMLGVLTYFMLFATLTGGMHLAIDTTAGERERRSLEPLLALPVTRANLILGKMTATVCYMLASLALTLAAFTVVLRQLPLGAIGMSSNFGIATAALAFLLVCPFAPLGAALMTTVASFTKTYREAQTYLTFVLLVPTLPLAFATFLNVEPELNLMWIPSLSQHLLITTLIKDQPLDAGLTALSVASTLAFGLLLGWLAVRLYRREAILG